MTVSVVDSLQDRTTYHACSFSQQNALHARNHHLLNNRVLRHIVFVTEFLGAQAIPAVFEDLDTETSGADAWDGLLDQLVLRVLG